MGDAGIKSAIQGSNVPNPDEAVPSFVSGAMAKAGKGLLDGKLQAGTSAVSDKLLDLVGLGGKSAADKGKDTRDYLAAAFPELNAWERAGADASFFFSIRRRHTSCLSDWSSDVCSSDLSLLHCLAPRFEIHCVTFAEVQPSQKAAEMLRSYVAEMTVLPLRLHRRTRLRRYARNIGREIGRASSREREEITRQRSESSK